MKTAYSARASGEIIRLLDYLRAKNPQGAARVAKAIERKVEQLAALPRSGRTTDQSGVRQVKLSRYPYRILYMIEFDRVRVLHVRHTSRRWPVKLSL